jgi:pimeloyl-ACP methyl ester carboxylesterase
MSIKSMWPALAAALICPMLCAQRLSDLTAPAPLPPGSTLVIGFLGGFERWDDDHRSVRQLTLKLRARQGVYAESISNRRRKVALELIRRALDTNQDGNLDPEERARARVILFGQSWGGAAALATARDLDQLGIPVLLTVQVDSMGLHDQVVPANVRAAVNFYQHDPLTIQGRAHIRAADPAKTRILGNFGASYFLRPVDETNASWARRTFGGSHAKMELDPIIWSQVEQYISGAIARRYRDPNDPS